MSCFHCFSSNKQGNNKTFYPPLEKKYFTSFENYRKYIESKTVKNKEIDDLYELFPNNKIQEETNSKSPFNNQRRGSLYNEVNFISKDYNNIKYPNLEINCYSIKNSSNLKNEIILLRIRNKSVDNIGNKEKNNFILKKDKEEDFHNGKLKFSNNNIDRDTLSIDSESSDKSEKITLLVSHSNNDDLGIIFPRLCDLATVLKCDVISYDYSGYGCSKNKPSYSSLKNDIIVVINFSVDTFDLRYENIVLLSFNIGAIPSIYISSLSAYCSIRGMILVSPKLNFIKKFNYSYINEVICPVFIIQGEFEENVEQKEIAKYIKKFKESIHWESKNSSNYEDIMNENRSKFFKKIRKFLSHVNTTRIKISQSIAESKDDIKIPKY